MKVVLEAGVVLAAALAVAPSPGAAGTKAGSPKQVARGEYLVTIAGCHDCHTPWKPGKNGPEPDMTRQLSGHPQTLSMPPLASAPPEPWMFVGAATLTAFRGPWGTSYAINLTPDEETGLGSWTQQMFVGAMRTGKHVGVGRPILPPMPWYNLAKMTDEDLAAVFAYLQSLPPVKNRVPDAEVAGGAGPR